MFWPTHLNNFSFLFLKTLAALCFVQCDINGKQLWITIPANAWTPSDVSGAASDNRCAKTQHSSVLHILPGIWNATGTAVKKKSARLEMERCRFSCTMMPSTYDNHVPLKIYLIDAWSVTVHRAVVKRNDMQPSMGTVIELGGRCTAYFLWIAQNGCWKPRLKDYIKPSMLQ